MGNKEWGTPVWPSKRVFYAAIFGSGGALAALAVVVCVVAGNALETLLDRIGGRMVLAVVVLTVLSAFARWSFERIAAKRGRVLPQINVVTVIRIHFMLSVLCAVPILGAGFVAALLIGSDLQASLLQAIYLLIVGSVLFVSFPLTIVDNVMQLTRWVTGRRADA